MDVTNDVRRSAAFVTDTLRPSLDRDDWARITQTTEWTCRNTLDHMVDALCGYAASLANLFTERPPHHPRNGDPSASPTELLQLVSTFAGVLSEVTKAAAITDRAFHRAGMADRDGFVAMGCDEVLIHGYDIATTFRAVYEPPSDLAARVLTRLFPWAPEDGNPWERLLWANGRSPLEDHDQLGPEWWWHCAPLEEWNGEVKRRSALDPPGWR